MRRNNKHLGKRHLEELYSPVLLFFLYCPAFCLQRRWLLIGFLGCLNYKTGKLAGAVLNIKLKCCLMFSVESSIFWEWTMNQSVLCSNSLYHELDIWCHSMGYQQSLKMQQCIVEVEGVWFKVLGEGVWGLTLSFLAIFLIEITFIIEVRQPSMPRYWAEEV